MNLNSFLLVFLGSGLGGCIRFGISHIVKSRFPTVFPFGTLSINLLACFVAGFLVGKLWNSETEAMRLLLLVGFCGGFSTFSALSVETLELVQKGHWTLVFVYLVASLLIGTVAVWIGKGSAT